MGQGEAMDIYVAADGFFRAKAERCRLSMILLLISWDGDRGSAGSEDLD